MSRSLVRGMRCQQPVADLAYRAAAPSQAGHMVCGSTGAGVRIGNRKSQSDLAQQRNIGGVIPNECALRGRHTELLGEGAKVAHFVATSLDHMADREFPTAPGHCRGAAPGNDGNVDAGVRQRLQAVAVLDVETLQLLPARAVIHASIGEHAIHIQDQQANRGRG
jgi:hypothetical protein